MGEMITKWRRDYKLGQGLQIGSAQLVLQNRTSAVKKGIIILNNPIVTDGTSLIIISADNITIRKYVLHAISCSNHTSTKERSKRHIFQFCKPFFMVYTHIIT